ncbi:UNVERIFIED_CONTAM: hypothetical protein Slati_2634600 [Sesamum latifolium]|uniref:U3 small nucleolar RNA-associated protein 20 N-terminal domain-containing protein n=1 Tax=Sesamum latifolium TaxID=2727402 RepID=A0AAW2VUR8_9LAMI
MVELVGLLLTMKIVDPDSEVLDKVLQLMLCILDGLSNYKKMQALLQVSSQWVPVFDLRSQRSFVPPDRKCQFYIPEYAGGKVLDALDIFAENLCHAHKEIRLSTLRILCYYEPIYYEHSKKEHTVESNTITDVCETSHADDPHNNMGLSAHRIAEQYIPVLLNGIIGIFHNRFSYLWNPALECLTVLNCQYSRMVWDRYVKYLGHGQLVFLTSHEQRGGGNNDSNNDTGLVGRFNCDIFPLFDSTPCATVLSLLIQSLQKVPSIAESNSHQIIPLFLKFLGYNVDEITSDVAAYTLDHKGKEWKGVLKEWLSLFRLLRNPKSFHQGQFFKDVLQYRLLDQRDADIQMKVLDCLLNWRDDFLLPYSEHLKNLINTKSLREELTRWNLSTKSADAIDVRHRAYIVPIVIQILMPKVRNLKMLGCQKNASVHHRRAVLGFLTQLGVTELPLFFWLLIKPLLSTSERDDASLKSFSSLFSSPKDEFDMSDILKHFTTDTVKALSWKKRYGFLHVVEDILAVFDESHLNPFLDLLMNCVVRILASCTSSGGSTNSRGLSSVQNCSSFDLDVADHDEVEDQIKFLDIKDRQEIRADLIV